MEPRFLRRAVRVLAAVLAVSAVVAQPTASTSGARPNVLWIYVEDMNAWLGCYGDDTVATPHIDGLARAGVRFDRAYMPAGVCSATRSAVITGTMQTTLGVHNHRSARADFRGKSMGEFDAIRLPDGVETVPELLRAAGYYTFNQGKTDYNFVFEPGELYDANQGQMNLARVDLGALWAPAVAAGRPFFGQIQLRGGKNRPDKIVDRAVVTIPPYYPDVPLVREEFAHHYDCVRETDAEVGAVLSALREDGLLDSTVVFFFTDHGFRMHRHKQFLYEGGIHVPLVVAGPGVPVGAVRDDLVSGIDLGATALAMCGVGVPASMEGRDVFADGFEPREFVVAARDRCDYTIERIRAVVTPRYKYLRNSLTDRPYMQPQYRDPWPVTKAMREMAASGALDATQMAFYGDERPAEELYDLEADPHEVRNLAGDPAHREALGRHRSVLDGWIRDSGDRGQEIESEAGLRCALLRWGEKCVNPEYAPVRRAMGDATSDRRILILGDSISMGYTPFVQSMLEGEAVVVRPRGNCQGTNHGVANIDEWLALDGGNWAVIWFNFGLHDLKRVHPETGRNSNDPNHPHQASPERYERQLRQIVDKLEATGATLIFATTTPVPPGGVRPHRDVADVLRYNAIATRVMVARGVAVHDLYAWVMPRTGRFQRKGDVHFSREGSRAFGGEVARGLRAALAARQK